VVVEANQKQAVYICNSENSVFTLGGKAKTVTIDNCKKCSVVVDDLISAVELVNSQRIQVQTQGKVPSIAVDKCDGVQIFLSDASIECNIVTSKSSEMNVSIKDGDEWVEQPIPEQFVSKFVGKKLKTEVSDLYSG